MLGYGAIGQFTIGQVSDFIGPIVQPWTDPPNPKIKAGLAIALIASGLSAPVFIKDEAKLQSRWYQQWRDPVRTLPNIGPHKVPAYTGPFFIKDEKTLQSRWYQSWSEPVRSKQLSISLIASGPIAPVLDPNRQITQFLVSRWYQQWTDPVRRIATPSRYEQPSWSIFQGPTVTPTGWISNLSDPVRKLEDRIGLRVRYPFIASAVHIGWFNHLSEPIRVKARLQVGLNPYLFYPSQPDLAVSWIGQFTDPIRTKSGIIAANQQVAAYYPFPFPSVSINIGWFNHLSDPIRRIRPTPNDQQFIPYQPTIPSFGWYGGLADPIRRIRTATPSEQPSWSLFQEPAPAISFGWYDPFSEPTRKKEDKISLRVKYPFIYGSVYISWFNSLSEPIRIKLRLNTAHQQALAFYPFPLPPPITVDNISWFNNLSDPTRRIRPTPTDQQFTQYPPIIPSFGWYEGLSDPVRKALQPTRYEQQSWSLFVEPAFISFGWFGSLSDPVRRIRPTPTDQQFLPYFPPTPSFGWFDGLTDPARRVQVTASFDSQSSVPLPTVSFGWFEGLADPRRRPQTVSFDPQSFVFQTTPVISFGWFGSLNEPSRRKILPISLDQDFSPFPQVSFSWFGGLSEPVRSKSKVAWTDHISFQFPIVPFSWFNRLDDPTLPKKRVIAPPYFSFSPSPIQLSFGWYGNLIDPVRIKPKALQQIFGVVPEFTTPFFYLAALNTTEQRDFFFAVLYQFNPPLRAYVDIIEIDPRHRGNLGIIEPAAEPSIIASIVPQSASVTGGTPVPTVAGARVAIIT